MAIKLEIPSDRPDIARVFGNALLQLAGDTAAPALAEHVHREPPSNEAETTVALDTNDEAVEPELENETIAHSGWRVDHNGVPFSAEFCANAAEPFYSSGKQAGQWKKRKGVTPEAYDAWYAAERAKPTAAPAAQDEAAAVDTSAAFGQAAKAAEPAPEQPLFKQPGDLMRWFAEMQTARLLTQQDLDDAYRLNGLDLGALFPPSANFQQNVSNVHAALLLKVPA